MIYSAFCGIVIIVRCFELWDVWRRLHTQRTQNTCSIRGEIVNIRLGGGEIDPGEESTWRFRLIFFSELDRACPEVLRDLKNYVFPLYQDLKIYKPQSWNDAESIHGGPDEIDNLKVALLAWADHYRVNESWVLESAFDNLINWMAFPGFNKWHMPVFICDGIESRKFRFDFPGWDPTGEQRDDYFNRIEEAFKTSVDQYLLGVITAARQQGLNNTVVKQDYKHLRRKFKWLVLYQVRGLSHRKIAEKYGVNVRSRKVARAYSVLENRRKTVGDGIKESALLCGLTLRARGSPGRPKNK